MTLPNAVLFPATSIPLHIFEPRYRQMLADVLESHRMFAIAAIDSSKISLPESPEPPRRIATAGVIHACRTADDGTSDLILSGLTRVEITAIVQESPYRLIRVTPLESYSTTATERLEQMRRALLSAVDKRCNLVKPLPREVRQLMREITDPSHLCDFVVHTLIGDADFKQRMLETLDAAERLRSTVSRFRREADLLKLHRRLQGGLADDGIPRN